MPFAMHAPLKTFYTLLVYLLIAVLSFPSALAQDNRSSLAQLDEQVKRGTLSDIEYIQAVNDWIDQAFADGINFPKDTLLSLLATLREKIWTKDVHPSYRINYYINLSNNASYGSREGESVYFLEKAEQKIINAFGEKPLLVAGRKCNTYIDHKHYGNVIATYESVRDYLHSFPTLVREEAINPNITSSYINVLHPTLLAYSATGDTSKVNEVLQLANEIYEELGPRVNHSSPVWFTIGFYMASMHQYRDFKTLNNQALSLQGIRAMETALYSDTTQTESLIGQLKPVLLTRACSTSWHTRSMIVRLTT